MKAPNSLLNFQEQMVAFIKQPFSGGRDLELISRIKSSEHLSAYERLEIYRSHYWRKEIRFLEEFFPVAVRFLGNETFGQKIAIPFLTQFPLVEFSTESALDSLPQWVEREYWGQDRDQVVLFTQADAILGKCSLAKKLKPFNPSLEVSPFSVSVTLQPYVQFAYFDCNVLSLAQEASKDQSASLLPFHEIPTYSIIFRSKSGFIHCETVDQKEFFFLRSFQSGLSLKEAIAHLEKIYTQRDWKIGKWPRRLPRFFGRSEGTLPKARPEARTKNLGQSRRRPKPIFQSRCVYPSNDYLAPYTWFDIWNQREIFILKNTM